MGTLYSVNSTTGQITTAAGITLAAPTSHSIRFESDTFGAGVYLTISFKLFKVSNAVFVTWATNNQSMASGTGNDNLTTLAGDELPTTFRPTLGGLYVPIRVHNNGSNIIQINLYLMPVHKI
jgi:hypothetical protein